MRDRFLPQEDELATLINGNASTLYTKLKRLDVESLGLPAHCLYYFRTSHFNRLFFSIETSAHLLYRSIKLGIKPVSETVVMDYGAGVGTLYMLAKLIGCQKVIYNDFLEEWRFSAMKIAEALGIHTDEYILGDIGQTLNILEEKNIRCDIITSRNVIEHIYKLDEFYGLLFRHQPQAIIFSSTTANFYNPAAHIKHVLWHRKWEKEYYKKRLEIIRSGGLVTDAQQQQLLAKKTRGLAGKDLLDAVADFSRAGTLPDPTVHYSNACEPTTGVWAEHMLTFSEYRNLISPDHYQISFLPGFWDTHYSASWKNIFARVMNWITGMAGSAGVLFAPFIYVIAEPKGAPITHKHA